MGDASFRRLATWPDPMMWLLAAGAATSRIEVGTAIYQVPLRPPVDLAQLQQLRTLLPADQRPPATGQAPARSVGGAA